MAHVQSGWILDSLVWQCGPCTSDWVLIVGISKEMAQRERCALVKVLHASLPRWALTLHWVRCTACLLGFYWDEVVSVRNIVYHHVHLPLHNLGCSWCMFLWVLQVFMWVSVSLHPQLVFNQTQFFLSRKVSAWRPQPAVSKQERFIRCLALMIYAAMSRRLQNLCAP